ncbi:MAG: cytochrome P450 [Elusimicrobiota bacterium]
MKIRLVRIACAALIALTPGLSAAQQFSAAMSSVRPSGGAAGAAGAAGVPAGRGEISAAALIPSFAGMTISGVDVPALLLQISQAPSLPEAIQPVLARILKASPDVRIADAQELAAAAADVRRQADEVLLANDPAGLARINSLAVLLDEPRARRVSALVSAQETAGQLKARNEDSAAAAPASAAADQARLDPHGRDCAPGAKCPVRWLFGARGEKAKISETPVVKVEGPEPPRASGWYLKQFKQMTKSMMDYITSAASSPAAKKAGMVLLNPLPFLKIYVVTSPPLVHQILASDAKKYSRSSVGELMLSRTFGKSILTAEGEEHHSIRKELQGAFRRQAVRVHAPEAIDLAEKRAAEWKPGQTIDITKEMHELALHMFARSFFGLDPASSSSVRILDAMRNLIEMMTRIFGSVPMPAWVPTQFNRDQKRIKGEVDAALYGLIDGRIAHPSENPTLLDELIAAEPMTPRRKQYIRDQLTALFFAGHETSANLLAWTFHLVAEHPRVEQKLREELREAVGARRLVPSDLDHLPYLKAVLFESMRLYPPGWLLDRAPNEDILVGGYKIPKGKQIFLPLFLLSRSDYFEGPDDFVPERFMGSKVEGKDAFIPFGEGLHYCLGSMFAMDSVQAAFATIMRHWRFSGVAQTETGRLLNAAPSIQVRVSALESDSSNAASDDELRAFVPAVARAIGSQAGAALNSRALTQFASRGEAFASEALLHPRMLARLVEALRIQDPAVVPETMAVMPVAERLKVLDSAAAAAELRTDAYVRAYLDMVGEGSISGLKAEALLAEVSRMWSEDQSFLTPDVRRRLEEIHARIVDIVERRRSAVNEFMRDIRGKISGGLFDETNTYVQTPEGWKIADFMPLPDYPTLEAAYKERLADIDAAPQGPWNKPALRTMEKFLELESTRKILLVESGDGALKRLTDKVHAALEAQRSAWVGAELEKLEAARESFRQYFDKGRAPQPEDFVVMSAYYDALFDKFEKTSAATQWRIAAWLTKGSLRDGYPSMDQYQTAWQVAMDRAYRWERDGFPGSLMLTMVAFSGWAMTLCAKMPDPFFRFLAGGAAILIAGASLAVYCSKQYGKRSRLLYSARGDGAGFHTDDLQGKDDFMNFFKKYHSEYKPVPTTGASLGMKGGLQLNVESSPKNAIIDP